jgi:sugar phosphate isomerase/epimerase
MAHPRLSHNIISTSCWPLPELLEGCRAAGVRNVGLWREPVAELGLARTVALLRDAGIGVSSLCRAGFFPVSDQEQARERRADNLRAIDEAVAVGASVLVILAGGLPSGSRDLDGARRQVTEAIAALAPVARDHGIRLAVEPLHPALCSDRSVISTLGQALDLVEQFPADAVGIMLDAYHVWWDPRLWSDLRRAGNRILGVQISDCPHELRDPLYGRELPGTGVIDLRRFLDAVDEVGYDGPIEVEIFNHHIWSRPGRDVLGDIVRGFDELVAGAVAPSVEDT